MITNTIYGYGGESDQVLKSPIRLEAYGVNSKDLLTGLPIIIAETEDIENTIINQLPVIRCGVSSYNNRFEEIVNTSSAMDALIINE